MTVFKRHLARSLLFAGLTAALFGQSPVWKVTRDGQTLYVGGSFHLLRAADLPLPTEFDQAYAASQKIYLETDLARVMSPEMQEIITARGLYPPGQSLQFGVNPATWERIEAYCAKSGLPLAHAAQMKPWLFILMMSALEMQKLGVTQEGADMIFFKRAQADGKPLASLESFEAHIDFLTGMGAGRESEMIRSSLDDLAKAIQDFPKLLAAWRAGDLATLEKEMLEEMRIKYPDIYKQLIVTRNNAWLTMLDGLLKSPEVEFVIAGFGHMAGPDGLIEQLRQRGCEITRVTAAK